jgi:regulator of sirC expression with transglutaminase-like and TPR domain
MTFMSVRSRKTFQQLVTLPDGAIPLAETALLMASEEYPQLEIRPYIDSLDGIADTIRSTMRAGDAPLETIDKINNILFETMGFRGNTENYYDPRNSFFNDVIERRIGIPITLSTLYLEIARRLEVPIVGVGMPGHFLVKYAARDVEFFLDPFNQGGILTLDDCRDRITEIYNGAVKFNERLLARVTHRQILLRMLHNLKAIYIKTESYEKSLAMVEMMMMVNPDDPEQYRDRGLLLLKRRQFEAAAKDLERYLKMAPRAADHAEIEEHYKDLRRIRALMN